MIGPLNEELVAEDMAQGQIANALVISECSADLGAPHQARLPITERGGKLLGALRGGELRPGSGPSEARSGQRDFDF